MNNLLKFMNESRNLAAKEALSEKKTLPTTLGGILGGSSSKKSLLMSRSPADYRKKRSIET